MTKVLEARDALRKSLYMAPTGKRSTKGEQFVSGPIYVYLWFRLRVPIQQALETALQSDYDR